MTPLALSDPGVVFLPWAMKAFLHELLRLPNCLPANILIDSSNSRSRSNTFGKKCVLSVSSARTFLFPHDLPDRWLYLYFQVQESVLYIEQGRHPLCELCTDLFVPNDAALDSGGESENFCFVHFCDASSRKWLLIEWKCHQDQATHPSQEFSWTHRTISHHEFSAHSQGSFTLECLQIQKATQSLLVLLMLVVTRDAHLLSFAWQSQQT